MPQASQWMNRPPGASGSSRISARERLPVGGAVHDSGGERSSPSQVWRRGIAPPTAKALLVSSNSTTATLPLSPVLRGSSTASATASAGHVKQADHGTL